MSRKLECNCHHQHKHIIDTEGVSYDICTKKETHSTHFLCRFHLHNRHCRDTCPSTGMNAYITDLQKETMDSYPITIIDETVDMSGAMGMQSEVIGEMRGENKAENENRISKKSNRKAKSLPVISLLHFVYEHRGRFPMLFYLSIGGNQFFLYPHLGQTPFSFSAIPHSGQRSISLTVSYSWEAAFTPLVKVSLAILSLSLSRS